MGLGDSAGVLLKIKADSKDAERDINNIQRELGGLGSAASALGSPLAIATAGLAAMGVAVTTAVTAVVKLTIAASEYGSAIFDASQKTGLTAETISALKFAADTSGSSLEKVTGAVAKFNVLLGEAALGNEKAADTLAKFGIQSRDTQTALEEALVTLAAETDATKQAAIAKALFKDRTADIMPVIKSFEGNLPGLMEKLQKLGVIMSEEDARAADEFGDTMDTLKEQAGALGRQFATELMPSIVNAMNAISDVMSENKGVATAWGQSVIQAIDGVKASWEPLMFLLTGGMYQATAALAGNQGQWVIWGTVVKSVLNVATGGLIALYEAMERVGMAFGNAQNSGTGSFGGPLAKPGMGGSLNLPSGGRSGGGKGGGGGGGGGGATKQDPEIEAAKSRTQKLVEIWQDSFDRIAAENELRLSKQEIDELEFIALSNALALQRLEKEKELNEELLKLDRIKGKDREEIEHKIDRLRTQISTQRIKNEKETNDEILKQIADYNKEIEKLVQDELKIREKADERRRALERKIADDKQKEREERLADLKARTGASGVDGGFAEGIVSAIGIMTDKTLTARDKMAAATNSIAASWTSMKDAVMGGINAFVNGIGSIIQNLILMGDTGPGAMKKLTAGVLAGIAAQAAILSIFELAKGFAALFFNPAEAAAHFKAAALFGVVAVGTGIAGRKVAGDSFSQATSGGASASGGNGANQQNNFTTRFNGFGNAMGEQIGRQNQVLAALEETVHRFDRKFNTATPGAVVMAGANEASRAIVGAVHSEYSDNPASVDGTMRGLGFAR